MSYTEIRIKPGEEVSIVSISFANLSPLVSLLFGVLILVFPKFLNYLIAAYLIIAGLLGLGILG